MVVEEEEEEDAYLNELPQLVSTLVVLRVSKGNGEKLGVNRGLIQ